MEIWKKIENFTNYEISNYGRIKRIKTRTCTKYGKILKLKKDKCGYFCICLYRNSSKRYYKTIHRLVLETFNPIENMKTLQVNHINGIKIDNRLENLEWVTLKENIQHMYKNGLKNQNGENNHMFGKHHTEKTKKLLREKNIGENNPNSILTEQDIIEIRKLLDEGILTQTEIGKLFGISKSTISAIKNNKIWSYINVE